MTTSLARRPENLRRVYPGRPGRPGHGQVPATGRLARHRRAVGRGTRHVTGPWVALSPSFILLPSLYPPLATSGRPRRWWP